MSVAVTILIDDAAVRRRLGQLVADLSPGPGRRALLNVLGRTAEKSLRRHFLWANEAKGNREGWKRSNFWSQIRAATAHDESRTTDDTATVVIADRRVAGPLFGGTWGAKESKYLALPIHPEAAGVRPRSGLIEGLFFVPSKRSGNTVGWLAAERGEQTTFFYRLQKTVTVPRDATALPRPDRVGAELVRAAAGHLKRQSGGPSAA